MDFKENRNLIISLAVGAIFVMTLMVLKAVLGDHEYLGANHRPVKENTSSAMKNSTDSTKTSESLSSNTSDGAGVIETVSSETIPEIPEETVTGTEEFESIDGEYPRMSAAQVREYMENENYEGEKIVFLTFDDGPSYKTTPRILDILKENGVHASFFYYTFGDMTDKKDVIERTLAEGHTIGLHTDSHEYSLLYPDDKADPEAIIYDLKTALLEIREVIPDFDTNFYRFPGGSFAGWSNMDAAKKAVQEWGVEYIDWNTSTGDALPDNDDMSPEGLLKYLHNYSQNTISNDKLIVVLMHDADWHAHSVEGLQGVIDYYKERGYTFGVLE